MRFSTTMRINLTNAFQIVGVSLALGLATCWASANGESEGEHR